MEVCMFKNAYFDILISLDPLVLLKQKLVALW